MKNALGQDIQYLECTCRDPAHARYLVYRPGQAQFDPKLYITDTWDHVPWYRRIWLAFLILVGKPSPGVEHCLTDESIVCLGKAIQKYNLVKALRHAIRVKKARKEAENGKASDRLDRAS